MLLLFLPFLLYTFPSLFFYIISLTFCFFLHCAIFSNSYLLLLLSVFSSTSCYFSSPCYYYYYYCHRRRWLSVPFSFTHVALFFRWFLLTHEHSYNRRNSNNNNQNRRTLAPCLTPLPRLSVLTHTHTEHQRRTSASVLLYRSHCTHKKKHYTTRSNYDVASILDTTQFFPGIRRDFRATKRTLSAVPEAQPTPEALSAITNHCTVMFYGPFRGRTRAFFATLDQKKRLVGYYKSALTTTTTKKALACDDDVSPLFFAGWVSSPLLLTFEPCR